MLRGALQVLGSMGACKIKEPALLLTFEVVESLQDGPRQSLMEMEKNYRIIARQSELAMRVIGISQTKLFENAAFALFDVLTDTENVEAKERMQLEVEGTDRDDLLVNWLRELLYLYQGSAYLLKEFTVQQIRDTAVKAEVSGEKLDPDRHEIRQEIAAVAYDQSHMQKTGDQWIAQVILQV